MKSLRVSFIYILVLTLSCALLTSSCGDNSTGPDVEQTDNNGDGNDDDGDPVDPPPSDNFNFDSGESTETDEGFKFDGTLKGTTSDGDEFSIGDGEYDVVLGADGETIESISGTGMPEFPDVGIHADMLEDFAWSELESHIEYEKGSYYISEYDTEIPLNPDRYYMNFRVFDENTDGKFELKQRANDFIYDFGELYIDIEDPAVFFKTQVPIPDGDGDNADDAVKSFWKKIASLAAEKGIQIGEQLFDVDSGTYLIVGLSNQGTFNTPEYELADFGLQDPETFMEFSGYDFLESLPSHAFLKFVSFPVPGTVGLLELSGEMSSYSDNGNKYVPIDLLVNRTEFSRTESYMGDLALAAPGLGLLLEGILPAVNEHTGRDLFGSDVDLSPIEGFIQYRAALPEDNPAFFRFGGSMENPVLTDIFGDEIKKFLISKPSTSVFTYLNVGPEEEDIFFYVEEDMEMVIPYYGQEDFLDAYVVFNEDGIAFSSYQELEIGPVNISAEGDGSIYSDSYNYRASVLGDITLPNDAVLGNRDLLIDISSDSGATVSGRTNLPFNIGESEVNGQVVTDGITMSGRVSAGSELALDTGMNLPTRELEMSVSTNPDSILTLYGETEVPFIGYNEMTGMINRDQYQFDGEVDRTLSFGNLDVPVSNGQLTVDSKEGVFLDGSISIPNLSSAEMTGEISEEQVFFESAVNRDILFGSTSLYMAEGNIKLNDSGGELNGTLELPANLKTAQVSGAINPDAMSLTGSLSNTLSYHGQNFTVSNSTLTANSASGVTAAYTILLNNSLKPEMSGSISENGYRFTGSNGFNRDVGWDIPVWGSVTASLSGTITTVITENGIELSGSGRVTYDGTEYWSGTLSIHPNWSTRSIEVCTTGSIEACAEI